MEQEFVVAVDSPRKTITAILQENRELLSMIMDCAEAIRNVVGPSEKLNETPAMEPQCVYDDVEMQLKMMHKIVDVLRAIRGTLGW